MENTPDWSTLPPEILAKITPYLDNKTSNFEEVCWDWLKVSSISYNQKNIKLGYSPWDDCAFNSQPIILLPKITFIANTLYTKLLKSNTYNNGQPMDGTLFESLCQKLLNLPYLPKDSETHKKFQILHRMGPKADTFKFWLNANRQLKKLKPIYISLLHDKGANDPMKDPSHNYYLAGNLYKGIKMYDKAEKCYLKHLELAEKPSRTHDLLDVFTILTKQNKHDEAKEYMDKAIQTFNALKETQEIMSGLESIASSFYKAGDYPVAFSYYEKALDLILKETIKNRLEQDFYLYINLYNCLMLMENQKEADQYMEEAIKQAQENVDHTHKSHEISRAYRKTGRYDEALLYANLSINNVDRPVCPHYPNNRAKIYTKLELTKNADDDIQRALIWSANLSATQSCCDAHLPESIAKFLTKAGRLEEAEKYIQIAEQLSQQLESCQRK